MEDITMELQEKMLAGCVYVINVAQDREEWRVLANMLMGHSVA
jgi:hypothetical protein